MHATILERPARLDRRTRLTRRTVGFWILAAALFTLMFAAAAPSPLYVVYQSRWGFSPAVLTLVFGVYAFALLLTLVTVGGISDHVGRRPVLALGLLVEAASMLVFLSANSVAWLMAARIVQGLATGALSGTFTAGIVDLQPPGRAQLAAVLNTGLATVGLAAGALGTGLLVQYAPAPTALVWALLAAAFVALAGAVAFIPETAPRQPGARKAAVASLRPRVAVPRVARGRFLAAVPPLVATWAMGGLYLSLGPLLAVGVLHLHSHLIGGLVVATFTGSGALASIVVRERDAGRVTVGGSLVLATGTVLAFVALTAGHAPLFFAGTAVAGLGFGSAFLGAFRSLAQAAPAGQRAELFAATFVVAYLAFSVPAIVAGLCVPALGLRDTAVGYGVGVLLLALSAVLPALVGRIVRPRQVPADS
jgi:MFS family permease